jgi:hypothetical protein
VARRSLSVAVIAVLGGPGCLITSNADFVQPKGTPPFLTSLKPAPYLVTPVRGAAGMYPAPRPITFDVISEDLPSKDLQAYLLLDFQGFSAPVEILWSNTMIPAGHIDDQGPREYTAPLSFPAGIQPGCHSVTLAVSHQFDLVPELLRVKLTPQDEEDVATATWWYQLIDASVSDPVSGCVIPPALTNDAGANPEAAP